MICATCHRKLKNPPMWVGGRPYGPLCGKRAQARPDPLAVDLFTSIDLDGAVLAANQRVHEGIEASGDQHLREMRAAWRATV